RTVSPAVDGGDAGKRAAIVAGESAADGVYAAHRATRAGKVVSSGTVRPAPVTSFAPSLAAPSWPTVTFAYRASSPSVVKSAIAVGASLVRMDVPGGNRSAIVWFLTARAPGSP